MFLGSFNDIIYSLKVGGKASSISKKSDVVEYSCNTIRSNIRFECESQQKFSTSIFMHPEDC